MKLDGLYISQVKIKPFDDDSYLADLPVVRWLLKAGKLEFTKPVTFIVGENGTGKSTIIEALAITAGFNAEGGSKNFDFSTRQTASSLYKYLTLSRSAHEKDGFFLRAESFYNVATQVDELGLNIQGYGGRSLHAQSHGESFMALVSNRFRGNGLYILDEPEAALSPVEADDAPGRDEAAGRRSFTVHHRHAFPHPARVSGRRDLSDHGGPRRQGQL